MTDFEQSMERFAQRKQDEVQKSTALEHSLRQAAITNPDEYANELVLARRSGFDVTALPDFRDEARQIGFFNDNPGLNRLWRDSPQTAGFLANPDNAKLASDDIENLSAWEKALQFGQRVGGSLASALPATNAALWGVARAGADTVSTLVTNPLMQAGVLPEDPAARAAATFAGLAASQRGYEKRWEGDLSNAGFVERSVLSGVKSLGQNLLAIPASVATGSPLPILGTLTAATGGQAYNQARDKGLSVAQSLPYATSQAAVEFATEKIPALWLLRDLKGGAGFLKTLGNQVIAEVPGEQAATLVQDLNEWATINPDKPFSAYLDERPSAAAQTLIATIVATGGQVGTTSAAQAVLDRVAGRDRRQQEAAQTRATVDQVNALATDSKLRTRMPDKFREFVAGIAGEDANVYVPAVQWNQYFQSQNLDPAQAAAQAGISTSDFAEAMAAGADLVMPLADFATHVAGTDAHATLAPHLRLTPGGTSEAELAAGSEQDQRALDDLVAQVGQEQEQASGSQQVYDDVLGQLLATGMERGTAERNATLMQSVFTTLGQRAGVDAANLYQQYGLNIRRPLPEVLTKQGTVDQLDTLLDRLRAGEMPQQQDMFGTPLTDFLRQFGLQDQGGELAGRDLDKNLRAFQRKLVRDDGLTLDDAVQKVLQAGYFDGKDQGSVSVSDLLNALLEEEQGTPYYSAAQRNDAAIALAQTLESLGDYLHQSGIDLSQLDNATVKRFLDSGEQPAAVTEQGQTVLGQGGQEIGPFGPIFTEYHHDAEGAIARLMQEQTGEAVGALHHPEIGNIDLVWGKPGNAAKDYKGGYGLSKIAAKHPEVMADLQGFISSLKLAEKDTTWATLESEDGKAVIRLDWDGVAKHWLVSAYEKRASTGKTSDTADVSQTGDTALRLTGPDETIADDIQKFYQSDSATRRGRIRFGADRQFNIDLLEKADLSTFLHESGHLYLEVLGDLAQSQDAPQQIRDDYQALLDWFGVESRDQIGTDQHEQFARGFEAYLMEGKAPSQETRALFARFRVWLTAIYRTLTRLNVTLTDDVRRVMDRMLASDEQIAAVSEQQGYQALFTSAADAGMTEAEFAAYRRTAEQAGHEARERLTREAMAELTREQTKWWKEAREGVHAEVEQEANNQPVYQALAFLQQGKQADGSALPEGMQAVKLSKAALVERYGAEFMKRLPKPYVYSKEGGADPDAVAELFSFSSGDELVQALAGARNKRELIKAETDARMRERFGDMLTDGTMAERAMGAVHNDQQADVMRAELRALRRKQRQARNDALDSIPSIQTFREAAASSIAMKQYRDLQPNVYLQAERRASREAFELAAKGKYDEAAQAKQRELLNHFLYREAVKAKEEFEKGADLARQYERPKKRAALGKAGQHFLEAIDELLNRYQFTRMSNRQAGLQAARQQFDLAEWRLKMEEAEPGSIDVPDWVINGQPKPYQLLTVEEMRGIVDAIKNVAHVAGRQNKLLSGAAKENFETTVSSIVASIEDSAQGQPVDNRTRDTWDNKAAALFNGFLASHRKLASFVREMDGFQDGGPLWEALIRPMNAAGEREATMRAEATQKLAKLLKPVLAGGKMGGKGLFFHGIGMSLNRGERLTVALNMGNAGNLQRLLDGRGWTLEQAETITGTLTESDWQFVQGVWDFFESYRPQIAEKERRITGIEPNWVEPQTLRTKYGELRGGYYPVKYDAKESGLAQQFAEAEEARQMMHSAFTSATTRRSFTRDRAAAVVGRPLALTFDGLFQGVNEVVHDLTWHEWLIDANKLLRNSKVDSAIRSHHGSETVSAIRKTVEDIARGDVPAQHEGEKVLNHFRVGATVAGLGWNLITALQQPLGLSQSVVRIGPKWVMQGMARYLRHPLDSIEQASEKSEFIRNRARTMQREINEIQNQISGTSETRQMVEASYFILIQKVQLVADIPTWWGAYDKAIAEGNDEYRAVALADQAVTDAQGGGQIKDLSRIQRGGPALKLFTNFYSYFNTAYNLGVEKTKQKWRNPAQWPSLAADYLLLYTVPAVFSTLLIEAITGSLDFDDEDWPEELAKKLAAAQISYLLGLLVYVREATAAVQAAAGVNQFNAAYGGPAGLRFFQEFTKFGKQVGQGEVDDALRRSLVNTSGIVFHLPSGQINRTIDGTSALIEGRTSNPTAVVFGAPRQ